jgi:hypothetical protein
MGHWLRTNGLGNITAQERYRTQLVIENINAIDAWRNGLDDAQRRRLNHPNASGMRGAEQRRLNGP